MKKLIAILLAIAMLAAMATTVSAADNTMALTTTVPAATYVLTIPASLDVPYGASVVALDMSEFTAETTNFGLRQLCIYIANTAPISDGTNNEYFEIAALHTGMESWRCWIGESQTRMYYRPTGPNNENPGWAIYENGEYKYFDTMEFNFEQNWESLKPGTHSGYVEFAVEVVF